MPHALALGGAVGALPAALREATITTSQLDAVWHALLRFYSAAGIGLHEAAHENIKKTQSRWPPERKFTPLFDDNFPEEEQFPRELDVEFRELDRGGRKVVLLRCNGLNLGDRLTDNIDEADFYRFHDIFHLAHAAYLGWSPILRSLLKCKRKSDPAADENQDGARAGIIEEAVSAAVFSRAKQIGCYEDIDHVDYDLLKTVSDLVRGFEVAKAPLWQWEHAILGGYRVFRELRANRGGHVAVDLIKRELRYTLRT